LSYLLLFYEFFEFLHENGFAEIDEMSSEFDVAQTGAIAIWREQVDLSV